MVIKTGKNVIIGCKDQVEISKILIGNLKKRGLRFEESLIFPLSVDGYRMVYGMFAAGQEEEIRDATWSPSKKSLNVTSRTRSIILMEPVMDQEEMKVKQGMKWLNLLGKKEGLTKKLKHIKVFIATWFSNAKFKDVQGAELLCALYSDLSRDLVFSSLPETGEGMVLEDAIKEFSWELDHVFPEKHEVVLDKLKSELWE
ncbi:MAG: hypothetical protein ACTSUE_02850 [Promethearchaeota archaeon]